MCRVGKEVGETMTGVTIPAVDILVGTLETFRRRGDAAAVEAIEALIQELKQGRKRRVIGGLSYNAESMGQIYDAAEKLVKNAERQADKLSRG